MCVACLFSVYVCWAVDWLAGSLFAWLVSFKVSWLAGG